MSISDIPILSALRSKMQWHQERQRVLANNVANSDTANFRPQDLVQPKFDKVGHPAAGGPVGSLALMHTSGGSDIFPTGGTSSFAANGQGGYETRPSGNAVDLETEMMKSTDNQMDYAAVTQLYTRSLGLLKTALGKG